MSPAPMRHTMPATFAPGPRPENFKEEFDLKGPLWVCLGVTERNNKDALKLSELVTRPLCDATSLATVSDDFGKYLCLFTDEECAKDYAQHIANDVRSIDRPHTLLDVISYFRMDLCNFVGVDLKMASTPIKFRAVYAINSAREQLLGQIVADRGKY